MIITISGTPGSGKSTVAKLLAEKLSAKRIDVGSIRRKLARKKKMTLEGLNQYAKTNPETDVNVDQKVAKEARKLAGQGKVVIVGGLPQFHFLPESVKIFIKADLKEAARRIWQDLQQKKTRTARNEGNYSSLKQMKERVLARIKEDNERYMKYYGIDHLDQSNYDLILNTTHITAEQAAKLILNKLRTK